MMRLYVVCEGLTETNFVRDILRPHIELRCPAPVTVEAPNLRGNCVYVGVRKLIRTLLGSRTNDVRVTTMIDLYRLPKDFPGHADCDCIESPSERVQELERFFLVDVPDQRFIPYLQLHEFEALLLSDPNCTREVIRAKCKHFDSWLQKLESRFES